MDPEILAVLALLGLNEKSTRQDAQDIISRADALEAERDAALEDLNAAKDELSRFDAKAMDFYRERRKLADLTEAWRVDGVDAMSNPELRKAVVLKARKEARQDADDMYYQVAVDMLPEPKPSDVQSVWEQVASKPTESEETRQDAEPIDVRQAMISNFDDAFRALTAN